MQTEKLLALAAAWRDTAAKNRKYAASCEGEERDLVKQIAYALEDCAKELEAEVAPLGVFRCDCNQCNGL